MPVARPCGVVLVKTVGRGKLKQESSPYSQMASAGDLFVQGRSAASQVLILTKNRMALGDWRADIIVCSKHTWYVSRITADSAWLADINFLKFRSHCLGLS